MPDSKRPTMLFYCQHSLGIGHLTRSFALADAMSAHFRIVFLNGGRLPAGVPVPAAVEVVDLPPLGMDDGHTVVSRDGRADVEAVRIERRRMIEAAVVALRPSVLLIELFPFGRKKFADEILPMIRRARTQPGGSARIVCSLRDILVDARPDQRRHDDRAAWLANRYFDAVLVHSDPAFATLHESFKPRRALRVPVVHTGFVLPRRSVQAARARADHVLVSAGGGIVGAPLFDAALDARALQPSLPPMRIVAGPFLPDDAFAALSRRSAATTGVTLLRHVPDMVAEMRNARASVSQCGYNTALDLIVSEVPALVVPYQTVTENEQLGRAGRLQRIGALRSVGADRIDAARMATEIRSLLAFEPRHASLALNGATRSADVLRECVADPRALHRAAMADGSDDRCAA